MDSLHQVETAPAGQPAPERPPFSVERVLEVVWDCAWEALVLAFLVQILGGVVVSVLGGLWNEMAPSPPPGLERPLHLTQSASHAVTGFFHEHTFKILFVVFLAAKTVARLRFPGQPGEAKETAARRIGRRLSEEWFSLVIVNAFTAFAAVMVLQVTQMFSFTHWIVHIVTAALQPLFQAGAAVLPGWFAWLGQFYDWFSDNQLKFTFWLLYAGAIGDDLGLPNYKALARWLWRRARRRAIPAATPPAA